MQLFVESDARPEALSGERLAVLGYGSQGRAHAMNLRDSGFDVVVGLRPGGARSAKAARDGFAVVDAAPRPSKAPDSSRSSCRTWPRRSSTRTSSPLSSGAPRCCSPMASTFITSRFEPRADLDVVLIAPKGPGDLVRRQYEAGRGVPCLMAVAQDATGNAQARALAYAHGIGGTRGGVLTTTFAEETETDLFGEQAVLCGGLTELIVRGFDTLVEAGYQPEVAYFECMHEVKLIVDLLHEGGLKKMHEFVSETAKFGDLTRGPRIMDEHVKDSMRQVLKEIQNGQFADEWIKENQTGLKNYKRLFNEDLDRGIEKVGPRAARTHELAQGVSSARGMTSAPGIPELRGVVAARPSNIITGPTGGACRRRRTGRPLGGRLAPEINGMPLKTSRFIWHEGKLVPWAEATVHVLSHALHYGSSVFEGVRVYETPSGPMGFRLTDHVRRLLNSGQGLPAQDPVFHGDARRGLQGGRARQRAHRGAYIRPIAFRGYGEMGVAGNPEEPARCSVAAWEWGSYLGEGGLEKGVDVCVSSWQRVAPNTVPAMAKAGGNYLSSILVTLEARRLGFAEGIALNTPDSSAKARARISFSCSRACSTRRPWRPRSWPASRATRSSSWPSRMGLTVVEQNIPREWLYIADEVFLTGSAAEITPVRSVDRIPSARAAAGPYRAAAERASSASSTARPRIAGAGSSRSCRAVRRT